MKIFAPIARIVVIPAVLFVGLMLPVQANASTMNHRGAVICPRQPVTNGTMKCFRIHHKSFSPYFYVTHKIDGTKVYVDISGNGWKSKHDAVKESKRLLRWLKSIGY